MKSKSDSLNRFRNKLEILCDTIEQDCGYNPGYLRSIINKPYVVQALSWITGKQFPSITFNRLQRMGRLDLSLEAFILGDDEIKSRYSDDIIKICEVRLARAGYQQLPDKGAPSEGFKRVVIVRRKNIDS